ncbi:hypothetical protein SAMN05421858_4819 [Haladaptatus litoreus]|uniref:Winged helix-turn-helix DNA-binding n=1 Tax=Haladaptatus litoreus TaxID=553468 RepID=A0A1N7F8H8_9EURY|nr:hypothetical protein [Haladaptatus litoreus]SIR96668.1 hypothetical protein SAMN05421858_4819 [Haladaptatus litoreus]
MTENESDRDEQGRFAEQTSDDDILRVIHAAEFPAVTARWVADTVGMERRPVHQRLEELHEQGKLERGKLSPRVVIWWIPEEWLQIEIVLEEECLRRSVHYSFLIGVSMSETDV